jgi:hypothetical protein
MPAESQEESIQSLGERQSAVHIIGLNNYINRYSSRTGQSIGVFPGLWRLPAFAQEA